MTESATSEDGVVANISGFHPEVAGSSPALRAPKSKDRRKGRFANCESCKNEFASFFHNKKWSRFCSRQCRTDWVSQNRKPQKPRKGRPGIPGPIPKRPQSLCLCGKTKSTHKAKQCQTCYRSLRKRQTAGKTLADMVASEYAHKNRYQKIRAAAVRSTQSFQKKCSVCGYAKYVEVAHIKGLSKFDMDAKISEINALDNLAFLCKNHHWEFDNGKLDDGLIVLSISDLNRIVVDKQ